jgi:hypothetical protein
MGHYKQLLHLLSMSIKKNLLSMLKDKNDKITFYNFKILNTQFLRKIIYNNLFN